METTLSNHTSTAPDEVIRLAQEAHTYIQKALQFEVDGTHDTLPVVDHYLNDTPRDQAEICDLVASAVGSYFGELLRDRFGGDWTLDGEDPARWRLKLTRCTLSFFPVAMAYQAVQQGQHEDRYDDGVYVDSEDREGLRQALDLSGPVPKEQYYTLCNRFDTLEYIVEMLMGRRAQKKQEEEPNEEPKSDECEGPSES
jgi:hypothetical protein